MKVTPVSFISWVTFHNEPPPPLIQFSRAQPLQHRLQQTGPVPRGHFEGQPPQSSIYGKSWENMEKVGKIWKKLCKIWKKLGKIWKKLEKYGKSWKNHGKSWKSWKAGNRIQEIYRNLIYIRDYDCLSLLQSTTTGMENIIRLRLDFCRASQVLSTAEEGPCSHGVQKFRTIGPKEWHCLWGIQTVEWFSYWTLSSAQVLNQICSKIPNSGPNPSKFT